MSMPQDIDARKYYRVSEQRLEDAERLLDKRINRPAASIYLAGYAVECILKALLLVNTPQARRPAKLRALKKDFGHDLHALKLDVRRTRALPDKFNKELVLLSTWSPNLRYEPGPGDPAQALQFFKAAKSVVQWAQGSM